MLQIRCLIVEMLLAIIKLAYVFVPLGFKPLEDFLNSIEHPQKKEDSFKILEMMKSVTKEDPKMWGDSIIGFGQYHYKYASGREGDWFLTGFSPRKQNLVLYIMAGINQYPELTQELGKCKTSKACLYIKLT